MTQTSLIVSLLSDGEPRNVPEIIRQTGVGEVLVRSALTRLVSRKDVTKHYGELIRYSITPAGHRKFEEQERGGNTPLVLMAQMRSPVSVWAYAARSAS